MYRKKRFRNRQRSRFTDDEEDSDIGNDSHSSSSSDTEDDDEIAYDRPQAKRRKGKRVCLSQNSSTSTYGAKSQRNAKKGNKECSLSQGASSHRQVSLSRLEASRSQGSQNSRSKDMATEEETQLASHVIRYLFALDRTKYPIQKAQIVKNIFGGSTKHYRQVMVAVKNILSEVFGYQLINIETNKYILINEIENNASYPRYATSEKAQLVLLHLVLTHVFMQENACREEALWKFLQNLGIVSDNEYHHEYFGNVKQLIEADFVGQKYLEKVPLNDNDDTVVYEYKWGIRAKLEFSPRTALQFVSKMYRGHSMESWSMQFAAMTMMEEESKNLER